LFFQFHVDRLAFDLPVIVVVQLLLRERGRGVQGIGIIVIDFQVLAQDVHIRLDDLDLLFLV